LKLLLPFRRIARREDQKKFGSAVFTIEKFPRSVGSPGFCQFQTSLLSQSELDGKPARKIHQSRSLRAQRRVEKSSLCFSRIASGQNMLAIPDDPEDLRQPEFIPRQEDPGSC
jgi:hypothetical protein